MVKNKIKLSFVLWLSVNLQNIKALFTEWMIQRQLIKWQTSCVCHVLWVCVLYVNLYAFVIQILLLWSLNHPLLIWAHPPLDSLQNAPTIRSFVCLNTCKKICLNFPLCFWSDLPPIFHCGSTETLVQPQAASVDRRLLAAAIPPCIVPIPRACASSHPYSTEYLSWPFLFYSLHSFDAPLPSTHRAQAEIHKKKHLTLLPFTQTHNIHLVRNRRGWNKETFGVGQWFLIVSITTVYSSFLLKCLTFYFLLLSYSTVRHLCLTLSHVKSHSCRD